MTFADREILITGGAGFIGSNLARRALQEGAHVVILDDLSRPGVKDNLRRLRAAHPGKNLSVEIGDVRQPATVRRAMRGVDAVLHLAAQVAVTTSVTDPARDFSVNMGGTLTVLEEVRRQRQPPSVLFTSTNKVYGNLLDIAVTRKRDRYVPVDHHVRRHGIGEDRPLAFCSPYGCSKGGADQYVLDYGNTYGLSTVAFRMSCIYGPQQCGNEDQGWVAHFLLRAMEDQPISIFGDGMQVRDALYVDDLVDAMELALANIDSCAGEAFNMGGGAANTVSLLELLTIIEALEGRAPSVGFHDWRVGDQRWFVSDTRKFFEATGWSPKVDITSGVRQLHEWLRDHRMVEPMEAAL